MDSRSPDTDSVSADITLTVTFGWGACFDCMNPALADEQDNPTNSPSDMVTALESLSDFTLEAAIEGKADTETTENGELTWRQEKRF